MSRSRDNIQNQLSELAKQRPRNQEDDNLTSEMTRLESILQVARDDLVRRHEFFLLSPCVYLGSYQSACNHKLQGIKDELKHIDRSLRQISPEYKKVLLLFLKLSHIHELDIFLHRHETRSISSTRRSNASRPW